MLKRIICISIAFFLFFAPGVLSQSGNCPKIKVGVKIAEIYPQVFDHLNKVYKTEKHRAVWLTELGELLMKSLRENSPELEFIYLSGSPIADYDYLFSSLIALSGGGEDVIVVPEYTIIEGDNIFTVPPVYGSEYTVYKVWSSLIVNSNCFPNRRYILGIENGESEDIYRAILSSLSGFGRGIAYTLYKRENERPVPPREPTVETRLEKEYLSPLEEDTRKMKIYEKVLSCNGRPSYFVGNHSQPVRFPSKTDRGDIEPAEGCKLENYNPEIQYILVNAAGDAVGEYTLKRGLDPLLEKITLSTCPLGNKPNIEKEVEFVIRGLELKVEPYRKIIYNGEKTTISIDLHEIDPYGVKYPATNREVEIKVTGLVDGTVSPADKVTTDNMGIAWIDYKAGQKDKQIKITATFTPPGYPETVKGEAAITVKKPEGDFNGTITYQRHVHWKDESEQPSGSLFMSVDLDENATIHVAARYLRTIKYSSGDSEVLYEATALSGNFSVSMKKIIVITDNDGNWTKNVDFWQGDKMIEPESGSNLLLTIEQQKKSYTIQSAISFPSVNGTSETTSSRGAKLTMEAENWRCHASFVVDGPTDGNSVNGNWSKPVTGNLAVTAAAGLLPGSTWNWSLSRTNKKSN